IGQRVQVEVIRHLGSPSESRETFTVPLKAVHTPSLITLKGGRRMNLAAIDPSSPPPVPRRLRLADLTDRGAGVASGRGFGPAPGVNNQLGGVPIGAVGVQPNIQLLQEGITLGANAVVSADRRYVRLSLAPNFTNVIDVFNFTFAGTNTGGGPTGGVPGGGFGGPTPGGF
ncbi:MAG: hypothetical protein AAF907_14500, partial [Planctomycetota bacterium]